MNPLLQSYYDFRLHSQVMKLKLNKEFMEKRLTPKYRKHDNLVIIVNGPSLNKMMDKAASHTQCDYMFMNGGCHLDLFEQVKPQFHVMVDPAFFTRKEDQDEIHYCTSKKTMETFNYKVAWPICLIRIPKGNPIISLNENFINSAYLSPIVLLPDDVKKYKVLYDSNFIVPTCQNAGHVAIFSGIMMGYKNIYIYGLDFDFIKNYYVDADNHIHVYTDHSFGERFDEDITLEGVNMMEQMDHEYTAYRAFYFDKAYAELCGTKIINCNTNSMIDCFEKAKMEVH